MVIGKTNGASSVNAGGGTSYTVTVTNNGPSEVTGAVVTDPAPTGMTIGAWSCAVTTAGSGGSVTTACGTASGSGALNTTANLKVGGVVTYTIAATVTAGSGTVTNTASVAPPSGTSNPGTGCVTGGGITRSFSSGTCSSSDADTVTVIPAPAASNDSATTPLNTPVKIIAYANDSASEGATLDLATIDVDPATAGRQISITVAGEGSFDASANDGTVTFTPVTGFTGVVTVPYTISDSLDQTSNTANITVTVLNTEASTGPAANNDGAATPLNTPVTIPATANDAPGTGQTLTASSVDLDPATAGQQTDVTTAQGTWDSG